VSDPCLHPKKRFDGIYRMDIHHPPIAVAWTCEVCRTSGATPWAEASFPERQQAHLAELSRDAASEMMG
jgi:hypothetical protein